jgi:Holliday junction resolvase-like predicted endonuclease
MERLLDADHAALQGAGRRWFERLLWQVEAEVTFSRYGEHGSIDLLAFHAATRTLVVVEVKTVVADLQALLRSLHAKTRLAGAIAREHGWQAQRTVPCLLLSESTTNRRRVEGAAPLLARFSLRAGAARAWLRMPGQAIGLLVFLSPPTTSRGGGRRAGRQRMRLRKSLVGVNRATTDDHRPSEPA